MLHGICKKIVLISILLVFSANAYELKDALALKNAELTNDNKAKYIKILTTLSQGGDKEAVFFLAEANEIGVHTDKNLTKAKELYITLIPNNTKALLRLGKISDDEDDYKKAYDFYQSAYENGESSALPALLNILLNNQTFENAHKYLNSAKQDISIDTELIKNVENSLASLEENKILKDTKSFLADKSKKVIYSTLDALKTMDGAFGALGYKRTETFIHLDYEPIIEIVLEKIDSRYEKDLAKKIAGESLVMLSVVESLDYIHDIDIELQKNHGQRVKAVEFEIGLRPVPKIITENMKDSK
ncbi:hypothetical protein SAMN06313486_10198 [Epsilonproteobacteria bacterium SCGC AD-308-P11]|jgi:hypothetical protein|nr:hypothetical protein SAMN06313486_10198 [Epsilonproteobacteria bacterium SCGC AD-308-P11]